MSEEKKHDDQRHRGGACVARFGIDVTTATLDLPDRFAPTREIWIEHKLAWEQLNENLAHYPRSSTAGQSIPS